MTVEPQNGIPVDMLWDGAVVSQHRQWLRAFILVQVGKPQDADDIVQEVFLRAYANREKYDSHQPFGAWLRGIGRNVVREYWRRCNRLPVAMGEESLAVLERVSAVEELRSADPDHERRRILALKDCLEQLTERARGMLRCRYTERLSSQSIAERLGMTTTAVDMGLSRARRLLLDCVSRKLERVQP